MLSESSGRIAPWLLPGWTANSNEDMQTAAASRVVSTCQTTTAATSRLELQAALQCAIALDAPCQARDCLLKVLREVCSAFDISRGVMISVPHLRLQGPRLPNRSFAAGKWTPGGKAF